MDTARCNQTDFTYSAQEFAAMQPKQRAQLKDHLVCPECESAAFFRHETKNGREACFGARPHDERCGLRAAQSTPKVPDSMWRVCALVLA